MEWNDDDDNLKSKLKLKKIKKRSIDNIGVPMTLLRR